MSESPSSSRPSSQIVSVLGVVAFAVMVTESVAVAVPSLTARLTMKSPSASGVIEVREAIVDAMQEAPVGTDAVAQPLPLAALVIAHR